MNSERCESCRYHHLEKDAPDGWWCGHSFKYACRSSAIWKDYFRPRGVKSRKRSTGLVVVRGTALGELPTAHGGRG
jgi:hypothetical protein